MYHYQNSNQQRLKARELLLDQLAHGQTLSYQQFADRMGIVKSPIISKVTTILEDLIAEDAANKQPLIAAMVIQKGTAQIPRPGFYQYLQQFGLFHGDCQGAEAVKWHQQELQKLHLWHRTNEK